jgi:hypothetical protein
MGVDQGLKKHFIIGNKQGVWKMGQTDTWEDIEQMIQIYDIETIVIDALPDLTVPRKLREKYPSKIWLHYYKREIRKGDFITWDYKTHTVYSDRTKIIQQVIDEMVERKIRFQMKPDELAAYVEAWKGVFKRVEQNSLGIDMDVWETTGEDHLVHATNYWRLAMEKVDGGATQIREWKDNTQIIDYTIAPEISKILENKEKEA